MNPMEYLLSTSQDNFEERALALFHHQYQNVSVYRSYADLVHRNHPKSLNEIPFLPISFFKTARIIDQESINIDLHFQSSGTGNSGRSQHFVLDKQWYDDSFSSGFTHFFGPVEEYVVLALLPNYVDQGDSSLVYMVNTLIQQSKQELSGFLLQEPSSLIERYRAAVSQGKKVIIFGVSYALLDLAELKIDLSEAIIIETGGMKGRRKELTKAELHAALIEGLGVDHVRSEYGMTELLSQGYSMKDGKFQVVPCMKILIRDPYDPFTLFPHERSGGINVIDLANQHSCAFIQTQDLGRIEGDGFYLEGRFDEADVRGCNLLVDQ
ncbi:MAG: acyl transferase [Crocinitomicaceae bacterium]|nr:acyl transferase [Crocinitomicaceae bacterium]